APGLITIKNGRLSPERDENRRRRGILAPSISTERSDMHVIIPTAGFGTRLRPHTFTKPKPLVKVAGNTVLGHVLDRLEDISVDEITFIVGYLGDQIRDYVDQHYDFKSNYVQQKELKGQAHAIWLAREYVSGPVLIIFVD